MTEIKDFRFRFGRALQATAHLVKRAGGKDHYLRLLKLLYIADREYLLTYGETITGDRVVAMDHGPVLSTVFDLIKGKATRSDDWAHHLQTLPESRMVYLREDPRTGLLCRASEKILNDVHEQYGYVSRYQLRDITHDFPEWKEYFQPKTSTLIPWDAILRLNGKENMVKIAADYIELDRYQCDLLGVSQ